MGCVEELPAALEIHQAVQEEFALVATLLGQKKFAKIHHHKNV